MSAVSQVIILIRLDGFKSSSIWIYFSQSRTKLSLYIRYFHLIIFNWISTTFKRLRIIYILLPLSSHKLRLLTCCQPTASYPPLVTLSLMDKHQSPFSISSNGPSLPPQSIAWCLSSCLFVFVAHAIPGWVPVSMSSYMSNNKIINSTNVSWHDSTL